MHSILAKDSECNQTPKSLLTKSRKREVANDPDTNSDLNLNDSQPAKKKRVPNKRPQTVMTKSKDGEIDNDFNSGSKLSLINKSPSTKKKQRKENIIPAQEFDKSIEMVEASAQNDPREILIPPEDVDKGISYNY